MRKLRLLLAGAVVAATVGTFGASSAASCTNTGTHTAAGGYKDSGCGAVHCGTTGMAPVQPGGVRGYTNTTSDGAEIEACNDQGPGNTQGRAVVQVSKDTSHPGARAILDTDDGQPFPPAFIIVQGSTEHPGAWCSTKGSSNNDGYKQPWNNPGPHSVSPLDSGGPAYCAPDLPI